MINIVFLINNASNFTTDSTSCKNNISNKPSIYKHKSLEKDKEDCFIWQHLRLVA